MKNFRPLGILLSVLALQVVSCQTVMRLVGPATPVPPPVRAPASTATPRGSAPTSTPRGPAPTAGPATAVPSSNTPTLGTLAESKQALADHPDSVLEALANEQYSSAQMEQMNRTFVYTIDLSAEQPVLWEYGWCATTQAILQQNLQNMSVAFALNDQPIPISQFYAYDSQSAGTSNSTLECHSYVAMLSHWPQGATTLQTVVTFSTKINDGISDYAPGKQTFAYTVTKP